MFLFVHVVGGSLINVKFLCKEDVHEGDVWVTYDFGEEA